MDALSGEILANPQRQRFQSLYSQTNAATLVNAQSRFCNESPADCSFEMRNYPAGTKASNDDKTVNYLIFCYSGYARISGTLFQNEILCAGEVIFVQRMSEFSSLALSNVTLLVHKFNNTVCRSEKCILSYLYSHKQSDAKTHCKLTASNSLNVLTNTITTYIMDGTCDLDLWRLKHKELIWVFTRYYTAEELRPFFRPMINDNIPFRNLVLTHYRKAEFTDNLAEMCGYGLYTFRRIFKKEFGVSPYKWLTMKRAEHIRYMLSLPYVPFCDIIDKFHFSSPAHFTNFCKRYIGDTPSNIRIKLQEKNALINRLAQIM